MVVAANILALIMVLGLCWVAMMWLSGRIHDHGEVTGNGHRVEPTVGSISHCAMCEGVGASHRRGRLEPCPQCEGTGILG